MVNRPFPWQWVKWVGLSNNQEYKNVRNAAALYAKTLNTPNSNGTAKAAKNAAAKENLNSAIRAYLNKNKVRFGPAPAPAPGRFAGLRATFSRAPAPGPAPGPAPAPVTNNNNNRAPNNRAPNTGNWPNGMYKSGTVNGRSTSVYKVGTDYYASLGVNKNGRGMWVKVKRDGNSNKYNPNKTNAGGNRGGGRYYVKTRNANNGRAVFTPTGNANAAAAKAAKYAKFKKFYTNTFNPKNPMGVLNAMLKNPNANIRNFSANNNVNKNANGRANFWREVTTRRTAAMPKKGDLQKFKNWYVGLPAPMSNQERAKRFVNINQNNSQRNAKFSGVITRNNNAANNTNASRKPFWDAVVAEMAQRRV